VYAVNIGDAAPFTHARARAAAVRAVFRHTCLMAEPAVLRGRTFGNLVVFASGAPLPTGALTRLLAADPFPARLLDDAALDRFVASAAPTTDASATPSPQVPPEVFA
jgi:hypothetical protein